MIRQPEQAFRTETAFYDCAYVRLRKDAVAAIDGDWLRSVSQHDLSSLIVMAHIRKSTIKLMTNTAPDFKKRADAAMILR